MMLYGWRPAPAKGDTMLAFPQNYYYQKEGATIYQGDCLEVLKTFPDNSIPCVICSPPYFGLRSYLKKDHPDKHKEIGSESSMQEHIQALLRVFKEVKRVLRKDGSCWVNYGDCYGGSGMGMSYAGKTCGPNSILKGKLDKFPEIGHSRGKYDMG